MSIFKQPLIQNPPQNLRRSDNSSTYSSNDDDFDDDDDGDGDGDGDGD